MPKYILRAIRKVAIFEVTGIEKTIDCENDVQIRLEAAKFANEAFANKTDMALEIVDEHGKQIGEGAGQGARRKDQEYGGFTPGF